MLSGPTYETPAEVRLVQAVSNIIFVFVTLMLGFGIFRKKLEEAMDYLVNEVIYSFNECTSII